MTVRVVLDSNVLISALHFGGKPEELLVLANEGSIALFLSSFILEETERVLREKLEWKEQAVRDAMAALKDAATIVHPTMTLEAVPQDETDNRILECAVEAHANFLVTGDQRHLLPLKQYKGIRILTPRECLDALVKQ
ncbi:MAG: putative toxin-antitoxin system toxin component, PIN family [Nitrospirae bacterium]|nr:putative toxin-antitoxin system toxin component, PIN family [Nitrospirota bacterium]